MQTNDELAILIIDGRQKAVDQTQMVMDQLFKLREQSNETAKLLGETQVALLRLTQKLGEQPYAR